MLKNDNENVIAIASAMEIYLAPIIVESLECSFGYLTNNQKTVMHFQNHDGFVYVPIDSATSHMADIKKHFLFNFQCVRFEWEEKGEFINKAVICSKENKNVLNQYITITSLIITETKKALDGLSQNQINLRNKIIQYGRATADLRYTLEDIMVFIKNTNCH